MKDTQINSTHLLPSTYTQYPREQSVNSKSINQSFKIKWQGSEGPEEETATRNQYFSPVIEAIKKKENQKCSTYKTKYKQQTKYEMMCVCVCTCSPAFWQEWVFTQNCWCFIVSSAVPAGSWERPELLRRPLHQFPSGFWLAGCLGPRWHRISCPRCEFWLLELLQGHSRLVSLRCGFSSLTNTGFHYLGNIKCLNRYTVGPRRRQCKKSFIWTFLTTVRKWKQMRDSIYYF